MRRDLFVFAGQSNMMGASVYPPRKPLSIQRSYEYKHKPRRLGRSTGIFVPSGYPVGEFSYVNMVRAYAPDMIDESGKSMLTNYRTNTYFCPSMSSLASEECHTEHSFSSFSESSAQYGATLAPFLAEEWEKRGYACAYAHIAKGSVRISHYLTDDMIAEYGHRMAEFNSIHRTHFDETIPPGHRMPGAADYFFEKCKDFFRDAKAAFPDDLSSRCFFWLQGEGDAGCSSVEYEIQMEILWEALKRSGFTHFFCIRVGFFGKPEITSIMKAQESFTKHAKGAYMLTRAASYFPYARRDESDWFISPPNEEYENCRDSFYGYGNQHMNEKGFSVIANHAAKNLYRVLIEGKEPRLEPEIIKNLSLRRLCNETISV